MITTVLLMGLLAAAPQAEPAGLDGRMRKLSDDLVEGLGKLGGDVRTRRYAVLAFHEVGPQAKKAQLGLIIMDRVGFNLRHDHNLTLVERSRLQDVVGEQALQQSGLVDMDEAAKVGALLDADALINGQVSDAGEDFLVTAQVVDVAAGGVVIANASARLPSRELLTLSKDAVVLKSRSDAVFRSALIPGWGQSYNGQPLKTALFLGAAGASVLGALVAAGVLGGLVAYYASCGAECQDGKGRMLGPLQLGLLTFTNLRTAMVPAGVAVAVLLGLAGTTWAVNLVDAFAFGPHS